MQPSEDGLGGPPPTASQPREHSKSLGASGGGYYFLHAHSYEIGIILPTIYSETKRKNLGELILFSFVCCGLERVRDTLIPRSQ
jgi:hypothetical protein